jgi:hypothetical protein
VQPVVFAVAEIGKAFCATFRELGRRKSPQGKPLLERQDGIVGVVGAVGTVGTVGTAEPTVTTLPSSVTGCFLPPSRCCCSGCRSCLTGSEERLPRV